MTKFIRIWRNCGRIAVGPVFIFKYGITIGYDYSVSVWWAKKTLHFSKQGPRTAH